MGQRWTALFKGHSEIEKKVNSRGRFIFYESFPGQASIIRSRDHHP